MMAEEQGVGMTDPLEVHLEAETYGLGERKIGSPMGIVILGGLDVTSHVSDMTLISGVNEVTRLELTLINIRVNRKE